MNIFLTGSTGFIGSHLARRLNELGHRLRCLVRNPNATTFAGLENIEIVRGDLNSPRGLSRLLEGVDIVFHLAGVTKAISPEEYYLGNYSATQNLITACRDHPGAIRQFLYLSSIAAVGPSHDGQLLCEDAPYHPVSDYGRSKMLGECEVLKAADRLPVTILRPSAVYGPGDRGFLDYLRLVKMGVLPSIGFGEKLLNLIYCEDLVEGIILAADKRSTIGETYFLGSEISYTEDDIGDAMARAIGVSPTKIHIPHVVVFGLGALNGMVGRLTGTPMIFNLQKAYEVTQNAWVCSVEKAGRDFGFRPCTSLETGMERTYRWYRKSGWL